MSQKTEHGTTVSYVIGFALSLVFTLIPYYLVTHQTTTGDRLLVAILGFAVLQMLIQVFFFLHLGRGPKPLYNVVFLTATVGAIIVVVGGSMYIMKHLHYNMTPAEASKQLAEDEAIYQIGGKKTGACQATKTNHKVTINNGRVSSLQVTAQLCDTLTFISQDGDAYTIVFSQAYAGQSEVSVRKGHNQTITLNQSGSYQFYNQSNPSVTGYLTIQ